MSGRTGRPPRGGVASTVVLSVRSTADERAEWEAAAAARGVQLSAWARDTLTEAAKKEASK